MSLLMDALKKAEQAKEARAQTESEPSPPTSESTLDDQPTQQDRGELSLEKELEESRAIDEAAGTEPAVSMDDLHAAQSLNNSGGFPILYPEDLAVQPEPEQPTPGSSSKRSHGRSSSAPSTLAIGAASPTQASTVLAAQEPPAKRSSMVLIGGIAFAVAALLAGGAYLMWTISQPSSLLVAEPAALPKSQPKPAVGAVTRRERARPLPEPVDRSPDVVEPAAVIAAHAPTPTDVIKPAPAAAESIPIKTKTSPVQEPSPGTFVAAPRDITIKRGQREHTVDPRLEKAWSLFNTQQYQDAATFYTKVLAEQPNNRDALLGLAGVAVASGRLRQAYTLYLRLLERDPADPLAQASVLALIGNVNPVEGESKIKNLLVRFPNTPYLHFTLGNLYADQQRWSEAQQAYFNAWTGDRTNADYLYNLAISLDNLGKTQPALIYYGQALKLAAQQNVNFSAEQVQARIKTLGP